MRLKFYIILVLFISGILSNAAIAQEIEANVIVNVEQLSMENRISVQTMQNDITSYINNQKFTEKKWEGPKIQVDINVFLQGGSNNKYAARVFIISKRSLDSKQNSSSIALKLIDTKWYFEYAQYASLTYNSMRYHPVSSLLDFYMLMIIGYDLDTYGELDGTQIYDKAKQICSTGEMGGGEGWSTRPSPGDYTRYNLINEMSDMRYEEFRKLIFSYFVDGLDQMDKEPEKGYQAVKDAIQNIALFKKNKLSGPSVFLQAFFDAKSDELANLFKGKEKEFYAILKYLDPTNSMLYEDARDGKLDK
ncbi:MAG: hypothetical protein HW421_2925 [Ignavibacteria bacterium]|nr:hypothetical protein [Ignavibacteria bacterium]